jgi:hypothetical protein
MTIETFAEHGEPDPGRADPALPQPAEAVSQAQAAQQAHTAQQPPAEADLQTRAAGTIAQALREHPPMAKEIKGTLRAHVHVQELSRRAKAAEQQQADAEQHESGLDIKLDPGERRILSFGLGAAITVGLVALDMFPLNWAAQAFDLAVAGTWLVTFILVVGSIGAMLGLEITRGHPRARGILAVVMAAAFLALVGLRTQFLTTVAGDPVLLALFQSALLTAISAGLVLCGSAILSRIRSPAHSRAHAAVRHAARAAIDARQAQAEAADKLHRHIGTLRQILLPWALRYAAPEGVGHASWVAALERAIYALFPMT